MLEFKQFAPLSPSVRSTLIIVAVLSIIFIIVGSKVKKLNPTETPKGFLFVFVALVDFFNNYVKDYIHGEKRFRFLAPYLFTIILFLSVANTISLIGLTPPLSNIGVAMTFSVLTFIMIKISEFKFQGIVNKLKNLVGPVKVLAPIMIPINLIGEVSTPFSMGLRLFVNLMSGTVMTVMVFTALNSLTWVLSVVAGVGLHAVFDIFFGLIQAFVFFMLSTVNISMASEA